MRLFADGLDIHKFLGGTKTTLLRKHHNLRPKLAWQLGAVRRLPDCRHELLLGIIVLKNPFHQNEIEAALNAV